MTISYRLARPLVRPLVGTGITPNHLTTLRLLVGLLACSLLMVGDVGWTWWAGWAWLLTVFLDAADGELARVGNMATPGGHVYDYTVDNVVNSVFFLAAGIGLRGSDLGYWAIGLGLVASVSVFLASYWSEAIETLVNTGEKAYSGALGFDLEELLYLMAPLAWLNWLKPVLIGAAVGGGSMMIVTGWRLKRLRLMPNQARSPANFD